MDINLPANPPIGFLVESRPNAPFLYCWNGKGWDVVKNPRVIPDTPGNSVDPEETGTMGIHKKITVDIHKEVPSGDIDDYNFMYELESLPVSGTEHLYLNGLLQKRGEEYDYTVLNKTIYFIEPPQVGAILVCSYSSTTYTEVRNEIPIGVIDGANDKFTLYAYPIEATEHIYLNGLLQKEGFLYDYTVLNNIITFNEPPQSGAIITVDYSSNI
jgi:hypothetical protein